MFSELLPNCGPYKQASFFTLQVENKVYKAEVLGMNDSRIHRNMKIARDDNTIKLGCSDWWRRIRKDIGASSYFSTRRAADVVSEACFIAMTGDRHDDRSRSDTVMSCMNFNS